MYVECTYTYAFLFFSLKITVSGELHCVVLYCESRGLIISCIIPSLKFGV